MKNCIITLAATLALAGCLDSPPPHLSEATSADFVTCTDDCESQHEPTCAAVGCVLPSGSSEIFEPCDDGQCFCRVLSGKYFALYCDAGDLNCEVPCTAPLPSS